MKVRHHGTPVIVCVRDSDGPGHAGSQAPNRLRKRSFGATRFCRHLEAAFRIMYDTCRRGELPRGFAVAPLAAAGAAPSFEQEG